METEILTSANVKNLNLRESKIEKPIEHHTESVDEERKMDVAADSQISEVRFSLKEFLNIQVCSMIFTLLQAPLLASLKIIHLLPY